MKGKSSTTPRCSDFMRRMTPASDERRISGSVKRGRPAKSCWSYRRMQMPFATRPQRPARWFADACAIFSIESSVVLLRTE